MEEKVQNVLQNSSGGKFYNFIHQYGNGYSGVVQSCTNKFLGKKIVKIPTTTTVQKGILNFFFHVWARRYSMDFLPFIPRSTHCSVLLHLS